MSKGAKPDTWMPLYVADYLADTMHLTTEQHGAYLLMLMTAWKRGGELPASDDQLAAITRLGPAGWKRHRTVLLAFFSPAGETLAHKRVAHELGKAVELTERRRSAGQAGAKSRWQADDKPDGNGNGKRIDDPPVNGWQTDAPAFVARPSPITEEGSVSDETDAAASLDRLSDLRGLPAAKGCWRLAVLVLTEQGGLSETKARSVIGKLKAGLSDDELWEIAEAAWRNETRDPVAYLTKAAEGVIERRGSVAIDAPSERQQRSWMEDWREKGAPGWRRHERGPYPGEEGCRVSPAIQREFGVEPVAGDLIDLTTRRATA